MKAGWKKAEKDFEGFFTDYGKGAFLHRLTDTAQAKATAGKGAFIVAQPSDYLLVVQGSTHFAEVKSSGDKTSFPHSNIQQGQINAARRITKAGGSYLFFIKNTRTEQWYIVPAQVIIHSKKKSTRWDEIEQYKWDTNDRIS